MGRSEVRQLTALVAVRFLPAEHDQLRQAADTQGVSLGELIRRAVRHELEGRDA